MKIEIRRHLALILIGVISLGVFGYLGIKQYKAYEIKESEMQKMTELQAEKDRQDKEAQSAELTKLKEEIESLKVNQNEFKKPTSAPTSVTTSAPSAIPDLDISKFLTSTGSIMCFKKNSDEKISATAFLMKKNNSFRIFTNRHVFEGKDNCLFSVTQAPKDLRRQGLYYLDASNYYTWNSYTDFGFFYLSNNAKNEIGGDNTSSANVEDLNYSLSYLPLCSAKAAQGERVYVIGYPSYSGDILNTSSRIVTDGIISGYQVAFVNNKPAFNNYYVSNKIDSGNSGSPAIAIEDNEFCLLGVTTWLSLGNYEAGGVIQNIRNIYFKDDGTPAQNPFEGLFE